MLAGLVIGIIFGVVVLGILTPLLIRWFIQRRKRRTTQIYILPPPVQPRSIAWSAAWSRVPPDAPPIPAAYEPMVSRARAPSVSGPIAVEYVPSPSSSVSTMAPRIRSLSDLAPIPAANFISAPTTPNSFQDSFAITPQTANFVLSPLENLTPRTLDEDSIPAFAHVTARTPVMWKARTFRSEAALSRYAVSAASDNASLMLSPRTPDRANTLHSASTGSSSLGYLTMDTPVVSTAVMYNLSNENLPSWNRASMVHLDQGLPPIPGTLVPTAYVPYRPSVG